MRRSAKPSAPAESSAQGSTPASADPRVAELEEELSLARERMAFLEHRLEVESRRADEEISALRRQIERGRLSPSSPVRGRLVVATCLLRVHSRDGEKVTIAANAPIPDSVDISALDPGTFIEKEV